MLNWLRTLLGPILFLALIVGVRPLSSFADDDPRARAERLAEQLVNASQNISRFYAQAPRRPNIFLPPSLQEIRFHMGQWMPERPSVVSIVSDGGGVDPIELRPAPDVYYDLTDADAKRFSRLSEQLKDSPGIDLRHRLIVAADFGFLMANLSVMREAAVRLVRINNYLGIQDIIIRALDRLYETTHGGYFVTMRDIGTLSWIFRRTRARVPAYPSEPISSCVSPKVDASVNTGYLDERDPRWVGLASAAITRGLAPHAVEGFYNDNLIAQANELIQHLLEIDARGGWALLDPNYRPSSGLVRVWRMFRLALIGDLAAPRWSAAPSRGALDKFTEDDELGTLMSRVIWRAFGDATAKLVDRSDPAFEKLTYFAILYSNQLRAGLPVLDLLSLYLDQALRNLESAPRSMSKFDRPCNKALGD